MKILAYFLLFGGPALSAFYFFRRAPGAGYGRRGAITWGVIAGLGYFLSWMAVNWFIDLAMPRWFYRIITRYDDAAGFCIVGIALAVAFLLAGMILLPTDKPYVTRKRPRIDGEDEVHDADSSNIHATVALGAPVALIFCPSCNRSVLPKANNLCPGCNKSLDTLPPT